MTARKSEHQYGVEHLVDFTAIYEADSLLGECENFVKEARSGQVSIPFHAFVKWRAKRRDNRLISSYEALTPRVAASVESLRIIIGEVVEKKENLRMQARHLQKRLEACINHNTVKLANIEEPIAEFRNLVSSISNASSLIKSMVAFNSDVLRQLNVEQVRKGKTIMSWSAKTSRPASPVSDAELATDSDHPLLMERLMVLREVRDKFVSALQQVLMQKETATVNLENCKESQTVLTNLLKRDVEEHNTESPFDHSRCTDCSCVHALTCDCTEHLSMLQTQSSEANKRLQMLVEVRERMRECWEQLKNIDEDGDVDDAPN